MEKKDIIQSFKDSWYLSDDTSVNYLGTAIKS